MSKLRLAAVGVWLALFALGCDSGNTLIPEGGNPKVPVEFAGPIDINLISEIPYSTARLAVTGDSRGGKSTFEDIVDDLNRIKPKPELVFHTGDMISDPGSGLEWYDFQKSIDDLNGAYAFYPVIGNHDVDDQGSEDIYRDLFAAPINQLYYDVEYRDLLLIVLDSELTGEHGQIINAQYDWLKNLLKQKGSKFRYRIVFVHRPLFPTANHIGGSLDQYPPERDRLHKLFQTYGVKLVFVGHEHIYDRQQIGGITYVTTGGGGAPAPDQANAYFHFVFLAENAQGLHGYCFALDGTLKDEFLVK